MGKAALETFLRKPSDVMVSIYNGNNTNKEIHINSNCTYSYLSKIILEFENLGLIKVSKREVGKKMLIQLTKQGIEVAEYLMIIKNKLKGLKK